ncbi:hypothetical protein EON65_22565 [archaeon]|nr:MAG: hypothetical protein EON65_22565 [archaeon]
MANVAELRFNFDRADNASESPLFERQMSTGSEYGEYEQLRVLIESLQQRIVRLERINTDLEGRLEDQAKQSMAVEAECISIDRTWKEKCSTLEQEIIKWKADYQAEKAKGDRLRDQLSRTERELYGILQRKYELMRGPATMGGKGGKMTAVEQLDIKRNISWDSHDSKVCFLLL